VEAVLGEPVESVLAIANGDIERYGARIEVPVTRAIASLWTPASVWDENPAYWYVSIESPVEAGHYELVWMDEFGANQVYIPLVLAEGTVTGVDWDPVDREELKPQLQQVALLERTRTVEESGEERGTFTATTRPNVSEVNTIITLATDMVLAQLPTLRFDPTHYDDVTNAIAMQAAILIEASFFREQLDEGSADIYTRLLQSAIISLNNKISADARIGTGLQSGGAALRIG
jgi:hypothetical protein